MAFISISSKLSPPTQYHIHWIESLNFLFFLIISLSTISKISLISNLLFNSSPTISIILRKGTVSLMYSANELVTLLPTPASDFSFIYIFVELLGIFSFFKSNNLFIKVDFPKPVFLIIIVVIYLNWEN